MLSAANISFRYKPSLDYVFDNYSFNIKPGEIMAILGPNGRGKTTLIKTLLELLPVNSGSITCVGHRSYVPQNALTPFDYSVREMVVMGCGQNKGLFTHVTKKDYKTADETLEKIGMLHLSEQGFATLSGGQKQMILVARALASKPDTLILDEPTSALDYKNQSCVLNILKQIGKEGKSVIFTTHCPHQALYASNKTMIMESSNKYLYGATKEILVSKNLTKLYGINIHKGSFDLNKNNFDFISPIFQENRV